MKLFTTEDLFESAKAQTGLSEFGGGQTFQQDFNLFISSLNADDVPAARRDVCRQYILNLLMNRLWFEKDLAKHPEILDEQLLPPVAIVSLPRAGTTKLQRILGEMDHFQNLIYWQCHNFARIPGQPDGGKAIRFKKAVDYLDWLAREEPNYLQTHPMVADEAEEEFLLMEASFRSFMLTSVFPVLEYTMWLAGGADQTPAYDYLVKQFKYIQWQFRLEGKTVKPWLLKSPGMLGCEDMMTKTFPQGMKLICTHRAPVEVMPSTARTAQYTRAFGHRIDSKVLGEPMLAWFGGGIQRYMDWRKQNRTVPILDLGFKEITNDSIGTARKVCDFLGIPLTEKIVQSIQQWDVKNPRNKYGKNEASMEEYGIDEAKMNQVFKPYIEEFGHYF